MKKALLILIILISSINSTYAEEILKQQNKYPDYGYMYLGEDKFENFNRKIFSFNLRLNKYAIRPIHTIWSSVMPEYGMNRIHSAYNNIEYPKRLVSSLIQKDFKTSKNETIRFLTNTTIGIGGMFDPANHFFKIEPSNENMEQALSKCKCNSGTYVVLPGINGTTPRGMVGKILDTSLNPTTYVGTPVLAMVKAGLTVNRTSLMQPLIKMVESTYADPYEISRKMYGIDNYIKCKNLDRKDTLEKGFNNSDNNLPKDINPELVNGVLNLKEAKNEEINNEKLTVADIVKGGINIENIILKSYKSPNSKLMADILIEDYKPQNPVVDSMRTAFFDLPEIDDSIWNELSIWNRSFSKKIKTSSINIFPEKINYKFRYIMQKNKNSPVVIIYPSIGEGINSHHSVVWAKLFYDKGYSVIIQGSHFQWEFVKSMPDGYAPGLPQKDADYLRIVTQKIVEKLESKYSCKFSQKTLIGTSFGALTTLFVANKEAKKNTLNITKYISICPPIDLIYAMKQVDKNGEEWKLNPNNLKARVATTASKIVQLANLKESTKDFNIDKLPFTEEEGKLITGFIMHQKLSDLIYTIEKIKRSQKSNIYDSINNINYNDYMNKYILSDKNNSINNIESECNLLSLSDFLKSNNNYKIYHSIDDYLTNSTQLKQLKINTGKKTILLSNGAHLGFLYKPEFIQAIEKDIKIIPTNTFNK